MREKNYLISDELGNLYTVKNWEELFDVLSIEELEDVYVVTKYTYSFEEAMLELVEKGILKRVISGTVPIEDIANSLDVMGERIGVERTKELDEKVSILLNKAENINPSNFVHLN